MRLARRSGCCCRSCARIAVRALGAATALGMAAALMLLLGQGVRRLIDGGFATSSRAHLDQAALLMFGVVAGLGLATGCASTWSPGSASGSPPTCAPRCSTVC